MSSTLTQSQATLVSSRTLPRHSLSPPKGYNHVLATRHAEAEVPGRQVQPKESRRRRYLLAADSSSNVQPRGSVGVATQTSQTASGPILLASGSWSGLQ